MEKVHAEFANKEPRNDFMDVAVGFAGAFAFFTVITILATVISIFI